MSTQSEIPPAAPLGNVEGLLQATGIASPPERITYAQHLGLGPQDIPLPPAPLPAQWQDPVFWSTTIVPIILAVVAFLFHKDLSADAPGLAAVGAAIATVAYAIYAAVRHTAHAKAVAAYYGMHAALFTGTTSRTFH